VTLDLAAAARILPLPASCGLQHYIKASTDNAFKFCAALQKLALTYSLQYAEYMQENMQEYMQKMTKSMQNNMQNMFKFECYLVYCDILQHILLILHIAICPIRPR
jgi:hypothetical protein